MALSRQTCPASRYAGRCHDAFDADPRGFATLHNLDIVMLISFFNHLWTLKQRRIA